MKNVIISILAAIIIGLVVFGILNNNNNNMLQTPSDSSEVTVAQESEIDDANIVSEQMSSRSDSCFVSPSSGDMWTLNSNQTIVLDTPPLYPEHCSNGFSLINAQNNQLAGHLMVGSQAGQTSYNYMVSDTLPMFSCGTGALDDPSTTSWISPGEYKIRFQESDVVEGTGPNVSCESEVFIIN